MRTGRKPDTGINRDTVRTFRMTPQESQNMDIQSAYRGFKTASQYLRWLIRNDAEPSREARFEREMKGV